MKQTFNTIANPFFSEFYLSVGLAFVIQILFVLFIPYSTKICKNHHNNDTTLVAHIVSVSKSNN